MSDDARGELLALADRLASEPSYQITQADVSLRIIPALRATPVPQCDAVSVDAAKAVNWERLAWVWQKRAFDAEAKLAAHQRTVTK